MSFTGSGPSEVSKQPPWWYHAWRQWWADRQAAVATFSPTCHTYLRTLLPVILPCWAQHLPTKNFWGFHEKLREWTSLKCRDNAYSIRLSGGCWVTVACKFDSDSTCLLKIRCSCVFYCQNMADHQKSNIYFSSNVCTVQVVEINATWEQHQ
jgi:hypothetical protein